MPARLRWVLAGASTLGVFAALFVGSVAARRHYLPEGVVVSGLAIDGETIVATDQDQLRAVVQAHATRATSRKVRLTMPGNAAAVLEASFEDLGLVVDVDETVRTATAFGKTGDVIGRYRDARRARAGEVDVPLAMTVDRRVALAKLEALKEVVDTQPLSARLDLEKHTTIPERNGRYVDPDGAIARLEQASRERGENVSIELPVAIFTPRISSEFLSKLDISTVVAEYETYFGRGGDQKKRGKNIDNAAAKIDGLVISPGELVSFNTVIGERSEANGFQKSWEIFKGEMVEGVGGGTCQVASTFHAAVFFGGFDILERLPHSRPSAYIPMGLDSTVVYPGVDLKVRNPHPFPVVVHAKTEGNKLRVELLGKSRPVRVGFERELVKTVAYKRKIVEEPTLSGKTVLVKQHGIKGFRIKRTRTLKFADGKTKKEEANDFYPPTLEIYHVPVGFDVALLPALPPGEGEGEALASGAESPAPAPPEARVPATNGAPGTATASTDSSPAVPAVDFVDSPGAHAPTSQQKDPARTLLMKR